MAFALPLLVPALAAMLAASPASAQPPAPNDVFVTLGTRGGPVPDGHRSQPANLLIVGRDAYLVDCGDGTAERLAAAGVRLGQLRAVFISHLHFDHIAGLQGILGLRYQTDAPGTLTIYGPPGTRAMVDGLVASMRPAAASGYGLPGAPNADPAAGVRVVELVGNARVEVGGFVVRTAENTHYSFLPGSPEAARFKSLSLRFDLGDRSIVYTGDTGPSAEVERLAQGADLLVSEMIDLPGTLESIRRSGAVMDETARLRLLQHLSSHHLSPEQVGELAAAAHVGRVVLTHLSGTSDAPAAVANYIRDVQTRFHGPVTVADDLGRF